eukprot:TRINITY_DN14476_c0_g1_i1.p1 TRINITY_DN14476_c0_g1~~TRINITY_DN14476_c0_g1_i1.p1  ORF type:complete len:287 (+),score=67.18 TRINITY_DN14476_c0_g1_i1:77-937(+)
MSAGDIIAVCVRLAKQPSVMVGSRTDAQQQRGQADIDMQQRCEALVELASSQPSRFLARYGRLLESNELSMFQNVQDDDVKYTVYKLQNTLKHRKARIKNRRFAKMQQLLKQGDYFSNEEMKQRAPWLYDSMIGKYMTDASIQTRVDSLARGTWSEQLLSQLDGQYASSRLHYEVEHAKSTRPEEEDDDEEANMAEAEPLAADADPTEDDVTFGDEDMETRELRRTALPEEERQRLELEFQQMMQERFLAGKDTEFVDYADIDDDERLDDLVTLGRDAEEAWFDAD